MLETSVARLLVVPEGEPLPRDAAARLAGGAPYLPYQRWRGFGAAVPRQLLQWELTHGHTDAGRHWRWLLLEDDAPVGMAWVAEAVWESRQLGIPVATLRHLIALGEDARQRQRRAAELLALLPPALDGGVACVSLRADAADAAVMAALQEQQWRLADTIVSFVCGREAITRLTRRVRARCAVRRMMPSDAPHLTRIAAASTFGGRLYRDPRFPQVRVEALYRAWAAECARGAFADVVVVAERQGEVVGFLASQLQPKLLAAAGIRLAGQGLLAILPGHRGLAMELVRGAVLEGSARADFGQFDIHLDNLEHLAMYARLRLRIAHVQHVWHRWMDGP